jgi:hypothetical protein
MEITFIPRWILSCLFADEERRFHFNCAVSALLIVAALPLLYVIPFLRAIPHFCLAQTLFGIPCPGCGITHALLALALFDLRGSWNANPAGFALTLLFIFQLFVRPLAILVPAASKNISRVGRWFSSASVIALMVVWILRVI